MDSNTVERTIRPHTLTRKNALFAGSDNGARHWTIAMTLIHGEVERRRSDGLARRSIGRVVSGRTKANELSTLLPWNWTARADVELAAAA